MSASAPTVGVSDTGLHHEALLYAGLEGFRQRVLPFVREGLERDEPVLVVVDAGKAELLRDELGSAARDVAFADMAEVGANPARIIPAWQVFVDEHRGRPVRGIGEPIGAERDPGELAECHRHEALLNVAFAGTPGFRLLCPYDVEALDPAVVHEARRTHPVVDGEPSAAYAGEEALPLGEPLPPPAGPFHAVAFEAATLDEVRRLVAGEAERAGLERGRAGGLVLAVSELAANSVRHGGGAGVARVWTEDDAVVCEVRDRGVVEDPLAGRVAPEPGATHGRGLWMANQLCDLVQVRAGAVRVRMRTAFA